MSDFCMECGHYRNPDCECTMSIGRKEYALLTRKLDKINEVLDIDTVGWATPKVLIDTLKRVQKEIDNE